LAQMTKGYGQGVGGVVVGGLLGEGQGEYYHGLDLLLGGVSVVGNRGLDLGRRVAEDGDTIGDGGDKHRGLKA